MIMTIEATYFYSIGCDLNLRSDHDAINNNVISEADTEFPSLLRINTYDTTTN